MVDEYELAWAAGFFDGEGSVHFAGASNLCYVSVGQKDRRPLQRFRDAVDVGNINGPYSNARGSWYHWSVGGRKAARVLKLLWPYLSEPKREKAQLVLPKRHYQFVIGWTLEMGGQPRPWDP